MIRHHAEWILPIAAPPIRRGWVACDSGRVAGLGAGAGTDGTAASPPFAGEPCAILPALVNAHTHIELSYAAGYVPPRERFDEWIRGLVAFRRQHPDPTLEPIVDRARAAIRQAHDSGTGLIGDISNTLITVPLFTEARMPAQVFHEVLGFKVTDVEGLVRRAREQVDASGTADVRVSLAPHAPYSVPPAMFHAIARDIAAHPGTVSSVHLAESRDEVEFLQDASGAIRTALEDLGAWNPAWTPPACCPIDYLARMNLLVPQMLIVHAVQLTDAELHQVKAAGAAIVTCPRSNVWTGAGPAPIARFYRSGVRLAVGTDSLASVGDLNLFSELAEMRSLAPAVAPGRILESATRGGAEALGFGDELGTIEPGKRASLIAVRLPADVTDVEEYLLTGIEPADIKWLDADQPVNR